jgi:hypothetical protein
MDGIDYKVALSSGIHPDVPMSMAGTQLSGNSAAFQGLAAQVKN